MKNAKRGNIADDDNYDPFPKTGPIKKYEPLIRKTVREYRERYPHFTYRELLIEAVRLASDAEQTFNPEKGKFGTHLRWHLKGLHRYAQKERKHEQVPIYTDPEARAEEIAEEKGEPTRPVNFAGGGNATRIAFDLQFRSAKKRHRVVAGTQLASSEENHATGVARRISSDLPGLIENQTPGPTLSGRIRALFAHEERCQREADQEAENAANGSYDSVFLEPAEFSTDVAFYRGRKPPRLLPGYMPVARLDDAYGHDDDWVSKLSDTIAGKDLEPLDPPANRDTDIGTGQAYLATIAAIEAEKQRPSLDKTDAYVLDWMLDRMVKQRPRTLTQAAADMGMTKGGFSKRFRKLANRLRERIRTQRGITKGGFSAAEHQQLRKLVDEAAGRRAERPLFGLVPCIADRLQKRVRKK